MPLTALIAAVREDAARPGGLRALLPVAGRPLIEHQARRAARVGAQDLLVVVDRLPPELAAVLDRLRADGITARVALGAADASGKLPDGATPLLIADGVLPSLEVLEEVAGAAAPAMLVFADAPGREDWERIDAVTRWAGVALMDAGALAETAAMLGDWDLELTLLRARVGVAARIPAEPGDVQRIADAGAAAGLADVLLQNEGSAVERAVIAWTMDRPIEARWLRIGAVALAVAGALTLGFGPVGAGLAALIASAPMDRLGRRLATIRLEATRIGPRWRQVRLGAMAAGLMLYGWRHSGQPGWEPLMLGGVTLAFLLAARNEGRIARLRPERWSAAPEPMLWAAAPVVLAGYGRWALAGLALWAAGSFFRLQWRALKG